MKFGKSLRNEISETVPQWEGECIWYKGLKQELNLIAAWHLEDHPETGRATNFTQLLHSELEKINAFLLTKEEDYVIRFKELKDMVADLDHSRNHRQVQNDLLDFHGEMVLLMHYGVLNFEGLIRIVKKHKKKTGSLIRLPSMEEVPQQQFFTTDLLHQLLKDCEAMLHQLLP